MCHHDRRNWSHCGACALVGGHTLSQSLWMGWILGKERYLAPWGYKARAPLAWGLRTVLEERNPPRSHLVGGSCHAKELNDHAVIKVGEWEAGAFLWPSVAEVFGSELQVCVCWAWFSVWDRKNSDTAEAPTTPFPLSISAECSYAIKQPHSVMGCPRHEEHFQLMGCSLPHTSQLPLPTDEWHTGFPGVPESVSSCRTRSVIKVFYSRHPLLPPLTVLFQVNISSQLPSSHPLLLRLIF